MKINKLTFHQFKHGVCGIYVNDDINKCVDVYKDHKGIIIHWKSSKYKSIESSKYTDRLEYWYELNKLIRKT